MILGNQTRNTQFDANEFRGIPASEIEVSDLTIPGDVYNEGLLDTTNSGYFRVKCEVSHFAYDDPIVFPNQPGRAHLHMFFGNTEANAYSTFDSLLNTGTGTCNGADLNRTAYWVPAVLNGNGDALIPYEIMVYYKNDNFRLNGANELVSPFPDNLRMIAGNGSATSPQTTPSGGPGSQPVIGFSCGPAYNANHLRQPLIPDCYGTGAGPFGADGRALEMQISFPQCFDEASGTYLADQSHMSYSEGGYYGARCPASHSTDVSSIMYRIFFSPDEYGGSLTGLHLSSDVKPDQILPGGTTAHADWFGAWHPETMQMWVDNCNNTQADCEIGLLDRDPAISLVPRQEGFYPGGYLAQAQELVKLCPGKTLDAANQLRSVASCNAGNGPAPEPQPTTDVMHAVSCLSGNGRIDTNFVNATNRAAVYRMEFQGLTARQATVEAGDWWRQSVTGRSDGTYNIVVTLDGTVVSQTAVTVACDGAVTVDPDEVQVVNACRNGFGYIIFQFVNPTPDTKSWIIEFEGVNNRSTSAAGYAASTRAVTGRPSGTYDVLIRTGAAEVASFPVTVSCP